MISCDGWKPITYSPKNDTCQTINEIRAHNAFYDWQCLNKETIIPGNACKNVKKSSIAGGR